MSKHNVGDRVWVAVVENRSVATPCPICIGKRQVTLILGSGDQVTLDCGYCGNGYEGPRGYIMESVFFAGSEQKTIAEIRERKTAGSEEVEFSFLDHHFVSGEQHLHESKEEAMKECEERCAEIEKDESTRAEYLKANDKKSYAWNAGYHLREAKLLAEKVAYHQGKAVLCKAIAKAEGGTA